MPDRATSRAGTVVRSAPWHPVVATTAAAAVLWVAAGLGRHTIVGFLAAVLAIAVGGAAAAYVLDEEATDVADATPTSRGRRVAWRTLVVVVPALVGLAGLLALRHIDAGTPWLRLGPLTAGALAAGVGVSAALRRAGVAAPGDLAGVSVCLGIVLLVAVEPLRRWVTLAPIADGAHVGRSVVVWMLVVAAGALSTVACAADPGRRLFRRDH
jgi:hypothetical protein